MVYFIILFVFLVICFVGAILSHQNKGNESNDETGKNEVGHEIPNKYRHWSDRDPTKHGYMRSDDD
tara:strand:- start:237 stop:434 length:198 start_codon:yes stop_codon:yes gene_type:complete